MHVISNKVFNVSIARYAFPTGPTVFFCVCVLLLLFVCLGGGGEQQASSLSIVANTSCGISTGTG